MAMRHQQLTNARRDRALRRADQLEVQLNDLMARASAAANAQVFRNHIRVATDLQRRIRALRLGHA
jgi:hypothetical protein